MSSGGKGGSGKRTVYCGTIAGVLGTGPAHSIRAIKVNAKDVWSGPVLRAGSANPAVLNLQGYGTGRWYWGTEDQPADTKLVRYGVQPGYRGSVVLVLDDIRFGNNGETNPPNIEVIWRRHPEQDIITTIGAQQDDAFTANGAAWACELLRSWDWLGLPASALDVDSFTALAAVIAADLPAGSARPRSSMAPLYTDQVPIRTALADCGLIPDAWFRVGLDGRLQAGYWPRGGPAGTVTEFTYADLTESPEIDGTDISDLPNAISVEYTDAAKLHKANSTLVKDDAAIRNAKGRMRKQTAKRSMLLTVDQAMSHGADLLAQAATPTTTATLTVFRSLAVRPDGQALRPGDYFVFPVQLLPELPPAQRLFRLVRREYGLTGPVTLIGELDRSAPAIDTVSASAIVDSAVVLPPVNWVRIFALPAAELAIYAVAARPADTVIGYDVRYDDDEEGDFPTVGNQPGCALPLLLQAACSAVATEVSVRLLAVTAGGANPRRDEHLLRNWSGGLTEARDDRLLLIVLKRDGADIERVGAVDYLEVMSVAGPATITATDTFSVPVLRGRRGTTALSFGGGDWEDYEAWLVPSSTLRPQDHADWLPAAEAGSTLWFRFRPYAVGAEYHGETAYAERQRRAAAAESLDEYAAQPDETDAPTVPYQIPAGYAAGDPTAPTLYEDLLDPVTPGTVNYSCRTRGGVASLVGYEAFVNPDTPPGKWLDIGGSWASAWNRYNTNCTAPDSIPTGTCTGSGAFSYDPSTGIKTGSASTDCTTSGHNVHADIGAFGANACGYAVTNTQTTSTASLGTPSCCVDNGVGYLYTAISGTRTLSAPDSEENAITRLLAGAGGTWSEWAAVTLPGCGSTRSERTTGFDFTYIEAEFKIVATGLQALGFAFVRVHISRTDLATSETVEAETHDFEVFGDATGQVEFVAVLPVEAGFSHFVSRVEYFGIPPT